MSGDAAALRVVAISDTHTMHDQLEGELAVPDGDVLVHTGDFTFDGNPDHVRDFDAFLASLPHRHKLVVAGNHDLIFEREPERARALLTSCTYLEDEGVTIEGVRFYGSPWQPWFMDWAFNLQRGEPLREVWARVPAGVDVLLTHGPPAGVLDVLVDGTAVGCEELAAALERIRPRFHVFGHIHEGAGVVERNGITFLNASSCDERYRVANPPLTFEVPRPVTSGAAP